MDSTTPESPAKVNNDRETFGAYIQIVGPVFYSREYGDKTKLLYGLLAAMTQAPRYYAFARNQTLIRFLGCSERTLQRCLAELEAAGEIIVEDGEGGRALRKIYLTRLRPVYPAKNDGGPPAKNDGGNKNKQSKNNSRAKLSTAAATQAEIIEWLDLWAAKLNLGADETVRLCRDLHAMVENRAAKGKPYNTINAAGLMTNRLLAFAEGSDTPSAVMRYILQESVSHNWEKIFPIKSDHMDDFYTFLRREYDVEPEPDPEREEGGELVWA